MDIFVSWWDTAVTWFVMGIFIALGFRAAKIVENILRFILKIILKKG